MGKKQKKANQQKHQNKISGQVEDLSGNLKQTNIMTKPNKKDRRKLKKQQNRLNINIQPNKKVNKDDEIQQNQKEHSLIEVQNQQIQGNQDQQSESLISIGSSQIQQVYGNDQELNAKGSQGFESLVDETNEKISEQVKSIFVKRRGINQVQQTFHIFHLKKQIFYKVSSLSHQKLNSTHLNQTVSLKIVDENLLRKGTQQSSSLFWLNGKLIHDQISFIRSTVFKVVKNQAQIKQNIRASSKDRKKNISTTQKLKQNIENFIKPSTPQQTQQIIQFLRDFEWNEDYLLVSKEQLTFVQTSSPFLNIDQKILTSNNSLLILGKKNSGKSTLSEYLKNINPNSICILDCDIGRSLSVSGCVSLLTEQQGINLWIGQFTPFNCIKNYVTAIKKLYQLYRQKYFSKKLVINTMGYLSGLGEMIIYEIYHLINPSQIIVLNSHQQSAVGNDNLSNILWNIKTGNYLTKLLTISSEDNRINELRQFSQKKINLNIQYLNNEHAQGKGIPMRFQNILMYKKNFKSIIELIKAVKRNQLQKVSNLNLLEQDKLGNVVNLNSKERNHGDMRIVLIGKWFSTNSKQQNINPNSDVDRQLFRVFGIGFGFQGDVYFSKEQIETILCPKINLREEISSLAGIVSEGVDFQKNFYLVSQLSLINFQLEHGQLPYILPIIKGMGSKGTRNNPSKNV